MSFVTPPKNLVVHSGKMVTFEAVVKGKRPIGEYSMIQFGLILQGDTSAR